MGAQRPRFVSNWVTAPVEHQEPPSRRWWPAVLVLAVISLTVSILVPAVRHQWAVSLVRQPTRYTALSFNKAWALPSDVSTYVPLPISFVIRNQEGQPVRYRYLVSQVSAGITTTLGQSARMVPAGHSWTVTTSIRPTCVLSPCHIEVSLPGHPEVIDFTALVK